MGTAPRAAWTRYDGDVMLTRKQVSEITGVPIPTLCRWGLAGKGPKVTCREPYYVRYRKADVEAWLAGDGATWKPSPPAGGAFRQIQHGAYGPADAVIPFGQVRPFVPSLEALDLCGVYFFCMGRRVLYLGQSKAVLRRLRQHVKSGLRDLGDADSVYVYLCPPEKLDAEEGAFLEFLTPSENRHYGPKSQLRSNPPKLGPMLDLRRQINGRWRVVPNVSE